MIPIGIQSLFYELSLDLSWVIPANFHNLDKLFESNADAVSRVCFKNFSQSFQFVFYLVFLDPAYFVVEFLYHILSLINGERMRFFPF